MMSRRRVRLPGPRSPSRLVMVGQGSARLREAEETSGTHAAHRAGMGPAACSACVKWTQNPFYFLEGTGIYGQAILVCCRFSVSILGIEITEHLSDDKHGKLTKQIYFEC